MYLYGPHCTTTIARSFAAAFSDDNGDLGEFGKVTTLLFHRLIEPMRNGDPIQIKFKSSTTKGLLETLEDAVETLTLEDDVPMEDS